MTNTIALPIDPPPIPDDGVRFFFHIMPGKWQETSLYTWGYHDIERLMSERLYDVDDNVDEWIWTYPLAFPEAWPPDLIQNWLWYECAPPYCTTRTP